MQWRCRSDWFLWHDQQLPWLQIQNNGCKHNRVHHINTALTRIGLPIHHPPHPNPADVPNICHQLRWPGRQDGQPHCYLHSLRCICNHIHQNDITIQWYHRLRLLLVHCDCSFSNSSYRRDQIEWLKRKISKDSSMEWEFVIDYPRLNQVYGFLNTYFWIFALYDMLGCNISWIFSK